ncbi:MAG: (2Fe-2S)-binding protein [Nitrososphaeria archaeon]|nr:(2Fe-2S)-binding protein [Nitrososphaeria archaeon]MDW8043835.1 (2Fe-2S)-binding protein [Nitrososphaerota archaeon]
MNVSLRVNGRTYQLDVRENERLVDVLRYRLGLMGVKEGCGEGDCGVCVVLMDGVPVHSCLVLAYRADGKEVTTVEGIGSAESLHPVQRAFVDAGAVQCGYCIPAAVLVAKWLHDGRVSSKEKVRWAFRGIMCRCGSYVRFEEAVRLVARRSGT